MSGDTPTARIDGKMGWRDVPLIPAAVRELAPLALENDLRPTESPWVFAVPTDPAYHLYRRLDVHRKVVAASGVPGWQRKHLRKSVRTWFGRVKGDELGRWALGHGGAGIDGRYDQSDRVAKLRQAFEEFYRAIAADDERERVERGARRRG